jgi:two-component system OmpR family sensor kinase
MVMPSVKSKRVTLGIWLAVGYTALLGVVLASFGLLLFLGMQRALQAEMDKRLEVRAGQLAQLLRANAGNASPFIAAMPGVDTSTTVTGPGDPAVYAQVRDLQGTVLEASSNLRGSALPLDQAEIKRVLAGQRIVKDGRIGDEPLRSLAIVLTEDKQPAAILQIAESRRSLDQTLSDLRHLLMLLGICACATAGALGWAITSRGLRPLAAVVSQARSIAGDRDFERRVDVPVSVAEAGLVAETINHLLATIDAVLQRHREFLADTSHELRNPLLVVRGNLELLDMLTEPEEREQCLSEARQQVERISRLVGDLLSLAQIEAGLVIEPKMMDLGRLLTRTIRSFEQRVSERTFVIEQAQSLPLVADEGRLEQVLTNLLDNAVRHTAPHGTITVRAENRDGLALLSVIDDGEGIAPEHLRYLFERFYRVGADSASTLRMGFGLPIVKRLVEGHGGRVTVESALGQGTRFSVWLPMPALRRADCERNGRRDRPA